MLSYNSFTGWAKKEYDFKNTWFLIFREGTAQVVRYVARILEIWIQFYDELLLKQNWNAFGVSTMFCSRTKSDKPLFFFVGMLKKKSLLL